jgi:predicted transcriptional regulator
VVALRNITLEWVMRKYVELLIKVQRRDGGMIIKEARLHMNKD